MGRNIESELCRRSASQERFIRYRSQHRQSLNKLEKARAMSVHELLHDTTPLSFPSTTTPQNTPPRKHITAAIGYLVPELELVKLRRQRTPEAQQDFERDFGKIIEFRSHIEELPLSLQIINTVYKKEIDIYERALKSKKKA